MRFSSNMLIAAFITAAAMMSVPAYATVVATPLTVGGGSSTFDFNGGHPSTAFSFTVAAGHTDDLNISAAYDPTDVDEELSISNSLNGGTFSTAVDYTIGSGGLSLAYTAGSWIVDVALVSEEDPKNDFSLTPVSSTPLPGALPLFAGGLGMVGFLSRRKKRKVANELVGA
jgi:hypothetical protein